MKETHTLDSLFAVIRQRQRDLPEGSYVAKLFKRGRAKIAQKVGEEAVETVIEAIAGDRKKLAEESADLLFHLLILWAEAGLKPADVMKVLESREGVSGLDEKANRTQTKKK